MKPTKGKWQYPFINYPKREKVLIRRRVRRFFKQGVLFVLLRGYFK